MLEPDYEIFLRLSACNQILTNSSNWADKQKLPPHGKPGMWHSLSDQKALFWKACFELVPGRNRENYSSHWCYYHCNARLGRFASIYLSIYISIIWHELMLGWKIASTQFKTNFGQERLTYWIMGAISSSTSWIHLSKNYPNIAFAFGIIAVEQAAQHTSYESGLNNPRVPREASVLPDTRTASMKWFGQSFPTFWLMIVSLRPWQKHFIVPTL